MKRGNETGTQLSGMYSNELETLGQLGGDDQSLALIRPLYPDGPTFLRAIHALLQCGDVSLLAKDHGSVPQWRWRELFVEGKALAELNRLTLSLTDQGVRRVR